MEVVPRPNAVLHDTRNVRHVIPARAWVAVFPDGEESFLVLTHGLDNAASSLVAGRHAWEPPGEASQEILEGGVEGEEVGEDVRVVGHEVLAHEDARGEVADKIADEGEEAGFGECSGRVYGDIGDSLPDALIYPAWREGDQVVSAFLNHFYSHCSSIRDEWFAIELK